MTFSCCKMKDAVDNWLIVSGMVELIFRRILPLDMNGFIGKPYLHILRCYKS